MSDTPPTSGQWLWKTLRPAGCVLVLVLLVIFLLLCFTQGADPLPGYTPPLAMEDYRADPAALRSELISQVLPQIEQYKQIHISDTQLSIQSGQVVVELSEADYPVVRSTMLYYFDRDLLEFKINN